MRNRLVKLFLYTGPPFGLFMGIISFISLGLYAGVLAGLISGILFGGIMTGVLGYMHVKSVKQSTSGASEDDYETRQSDEIDMPVSYDMTYELCIKSVDELKNPTIENKDYSQGRIDIKTGASWDTWGDSVSIKLIEIDENKTNIEVESQPDSHQIVDYGKNLKNVEAIVSFLKGQEV